MLWYTLYTEKWIDLGFVLNPYDQCVANKLINGKQCTVAWHVDDNKISHEDKNVVTEIIGTLEKFFGKFSVTRGKCHDYLGMKLRIRDDSKVEVDMVESIQQILDDFSEPLVGHVTSPATSELYTQEEDAELLVGAKHDEFHSFTQKLLHVCKRARPDIEPAVAYFTTRVQKSTITDWWKLIRTLKWLKCTIADVRVMGIDDSGSLHTYVDVAYGVHVDLRSQTGGVMSMGHGTFSQKSRKQKLNTKSSTEAEVVGVADMLPYNIWLRNFLKSQGYILTENILYQDNQSAIRMEKNGRRSCTGNSRHISIRYFL